MRAWFCTMIVLGACTTRAECEARVEAAIAQGEDDGAACALRLDALEEPTCGGSDRRPELSYYAAFCGVADIDACVDPDASLRELCFGDPAR
jgi:hypothetical protein